jgi:hypothetical protein
MLAFAHIPTGTTANSGFDRDEVRVHCGPEDAHPLLQADRWRPFEHLFVQASLDFTGQAGRAGADRNCRLCPAVIHARRCRAAVSGSRRRLGDAIAAGPNAELRECVTWQNIVTRIS